MIVFNNKEITDIHLGRKAILAVYKGAKLVWEKITEIFSCFSNGYWMDNYPWVDTETWTD